MKWWRRRELNPRPRKSTAKDYVRFRFGGFRPPRAEPARARRLSLIGLGCGLQADAFDLSCHDDALRLPAVPNSPGRLGKYVSSAGNTKICSCCFPMGL